MNPVLARERTALFLYVVLLVLPAVVFGALLTHRLWRDHEVELAAVPQRCTNAARRLAEAVANALELRLDAESARPFFQYKERFLDPETMAGVALEATPLLHEPRPKGVLGWYAYDRYDSRSTDGARYFLGRDPALELAQLRKIVKRDLTDSEERDHLILEHYVEENIEGEGVTYLYTFRVLGVNLHQGPEDECMRLPEEAGEWIHRTGKVRVTSLRLSLIQDSADELRLVAERLVHVPGEILPIVAPMCIQHLSHPHQEYQGVVLDPVWLFEELPAELARQVLDSSQRLVRESDVARLDPDEFSVCHANFFDVLPVGYRVESAQGLGELYITTDKTELRDRFRIQLGWLVGVAAVLTMSMGVGVRLLIGRIQASHDEALRTRNFVAAVTHELRTPIAAVKLYGEMLADGWIQDGPKRQEYLDRIVRETDRLSSLVDRVLLRRKLQDQPPAAQAGDLNEEVRAQESELLLVGGEIAHDLAFDLAPDLPPVLLVPEGIHVVLTNLVENARKYAPVDVSRPGAEPITVRTRRDGRGAVVLEVLDRGPGVRESERERVFEAFYRPGDERTRATKGTGLGLHLVALQARAMRGKVEVLPRKGGGCRFKLTFRLA